MFNIKIHCIVFGANEKLNKRCILSLDKDNLVFPNFNLTIEQVTKINSSIIEFLKQFIFVNDLVLIPQIISLNNTILDDSEHNDTNTLNMVFGFIIDYNSSIDNSKVNWIDFDPMIEHKLSPVIFETMQKLT